MESAFNAIDVVPRSVVMQTHLSIPVSHWKAKGTNNSWAQMTLTKRTLVSKVEEFPLKTNGITKH